MSKGFPFIPFLQVKGYSLQWNQSDRHVEAYPGFRALDGMLAHWPIGPHPNSLPLHQPTLSLVKWYPLLHQGRERRCTRRVFAQEHNTVAKARMSSTWSDQKTIGRSFVLFISAVYFSSKNFPSLGLKAIKFKIKCQTQQALFGTVKVRKSKTTLFGTARTYAFIYTQLRCSLLWLKKNKILEWGRFWFNSAKQNRRFTCEVTAYEIIRNAWIVVSCLAIPSILLHCKLLVIICMSGFMKQCQRKSRRLKRIFFSP